MEKDHLKSSTYYILGILAVVLTTIGVTYAFFTAQITGGEEATSITVQGGTLNIVYASGSSINIQNISPSSLSVLTKTFTVTGNNTTDLLMPYNIKLVVNSNTFTTDAISYTLTGTNDGGNGETAPNVTHNPGITTGTNTVLIGAGTFNGPTSGNKVHSYSLDIFFLDTRVDQNIDQGKDFKAHILIDQ